jgi:hypothetical protein
MTYVLTLLLLMSGEMVGADVTLPSDADCVRTASAIAEDNHAQLVAFRCTIEVGV